MNITETRTRWQENKDAFEAAADAMADLSDSAPDVEARRVERTFQRTKAAFEEMDVRLKREEDIAEGRSRSPLPGGIIPRPDGHARGETGFENIYRPDTGPSYFLDQANASRGDGHARERLERNNRFAMEKFGFGTPGERDAENRDLTSGTSAGGAFYPPIYLAELFVNVARGGRPFADALQTLPLPSTGLSITLPSLDTGVTVAEQVDTGSVEEVDATSSVKTFGVFFIAGQQDIWRGVLERSEPGLDVIIMNDLTRAYDELLDKRLLAGTGTTMHDGLSHISGTNAVTYTDASPTGPELLPFLYGGVSQINSANRGPANLVVWHPRRAAWMASQFSAGGAPIFAQGGFTWAIGSQDGGQAMNPMGLKSVIDPNVSTVKGTGTNQDEIYILNSNYLYLLEGALQTRVFEEVGSGTAAIRLQAFAYSAFIGSRVPKAISVVGGTGLVGPSGF